MTQELIERLRQKAGQYDEYDWHSVTELEAADALERMVTELETANRIKTEQIDYAIGLQISIEAHCREELAPEDVCPHHAEKLNEHFNRQQVLEKEHTEFYSEVVTLRSTVEHLRLRENRLTAERDALKEQMTADRKQFLDMRDERDALRADAMRYRFIKDGNAYIEPNHYDEDGKVTKEMYMALETGKYYADMRDFDMDIDAAIGEKHDLPVA